MHAFRLEYKLYCTEAVGWCEPARTHLQSWGEGVKGEGLCRGFRPGGMWGCRNSAERLCCIKGVESL